MGVFEFISGRKKPTPGELAKQRLKVALVQDRVKVNPELLELIKADLLTVISRRLEIDEQNAEADRHAQRNNGCPLQSHSSAE